MEQTAVEKDSKGSEINKLKKEYHVSFPNDFVEVINVESYKSYNILNDKKEYIDRIENICNEEEENEEEDEDENKFDINNYNPIKLEKMANNDPNGFSGTRCIIL